MKRETIMLNEKGRIAAAEAVKAEADNFPSPVRFYVNGEAAHRRGELSGSSSIDDWLLLSDAAIIAYLSEAPEDVAGVEWPRKDLADWSALPQDIYVVGAKSPDGIVFDVACCSVPMAIGPEVRYTLATAAETEVSTLRARIAELEAALRPFADAAAGWDTPPDHEDPQHYQARHEDTERLGSYWGCMNDDEREPNALTFGHLRAARRYVEEGK